VNKDNDELLDAVEINPEGEGPPKASVIWLHGLGADGHDFPPIVPELRIPREARVRFVFPHAPMRAVTINGGAIMRAWYDITNLDLERSVVEEHIAASRRQVEAWVGHERKLGVASERIILAGFSQGGAIALETGLQHEATLGGLLALSCYHPIPRHIAERASPANRNVPIFMAHGTFDPLIPVQVAERTRDELRRKGYAPEWHTYPMPHAVSPQEVVDIGAWLRRVLEL
jgi:phospholipase/carboxylesterase